MSQRAEGSQNASSSVTTNGGYATQDQRLKYISDCKLRRLNFKSLINFFNLLNFEDNFPFCDESSKYEKVAKIGQGTFG